MNASSGSGECPRSRSMPEQSQNHLWLQPSVDEIFRGGSGGRVRFSSIAIAIAMNSFHLTLHLAPTCASSGRIKEVTDTSDHSEKNEVGKTEQRNQHAYFARHFAEITKQNLEQRFAKSNASGRDR